MVSFLQAAQNYADSPGGTTFATPAMTVGSGNGLIVVSRVFTANLTGVADTAGNTYTQVGAVLSGNDHMYVHAALNITGHAANVITASYDSGVSFVGIIACEYAGLAGPFDELTEKTGSGTSITSNAFSTKAANSLLVVAAQSTGTGHVWSASGYSLRKQTTTHGTVAFFDRETTAIETGITVTAESTVNGFKTLVVVGVSADVPLVWLPQIAGGWAGASGGGIASGAN